MGLLRELDRGGGGRAYWDRVFGGARPESTDKRPYGSQKPLPGGSWGRGVLTANQSSFQRLLEAMRSDAPGGWSDDRYEQTLRHFTGITYVAVHRVSLQLARSEFRVYREDDSHPDGKRPVTRDDEAWELVRLLKRPNGQDTFGRLMYRWSQQRRLTGTALTWLVPNHFGKPYEMYSVPTALAIPQPVVNPDFPHGFYRIQPVYPYGPFSTFPTPAYAVGAPIGGEWMMKFQYPHPLLRYEGYSPLTGMKLHIDSLEMIDRARHYMMRRGIFPSAVLNGQDVEGGSELDDVALDRIKAQFEGEHQGPENMGRLLVAYAGWKLEQWGVPPSEMAFDGGWEQLSSFILGGGFGITKPAAGMIEDASYSTLFATMKQLHMVTLEPETDEIGQELTRHLGKYWGDDIVIEVRTPRIDDHEIKHARLNMLMSAKALTKNELRKALDEPLWPDERGDEIAGELPQKEQGMGAPGMDMGTGEDMPLEEDGGESIGQEESFAEEGALEEDPVAALLEGLSGGGEDEDELDRPRTGPLGEGSLGPRMGTLPGGKGLARRRRKSFYELAREVMRNGH